MDVIGPGATYYVVDLATMEDSERRRLFDEVHQQILMPAFPSNEMTPLGVLQQMWAGAPPRLAVHAALDSRGQPVGCAVAQWFPRSTVLLFAYLAVRVDWRGGGIGTSLITRAVRAWAAAYRPALVLAEVEDPRVYPCTPDQDPLARLRLYARLGARLLELRYVQPEVSPGAGRVRDLLLLVAQKCSAGVVSASSEVVGVPAAVVLAFLDEYYRDSEGEAHRDAEFLAMVRPLTNRDVVPLSSIHAWEAKHR
ncbi:MAG: GNAT family N-acetyltransferase [Pseudonocardiaceae bacterium]